MNKILSNEIDSLIYGLSTTDERNSFYRKRTEEVLHKFDTLYDTVRNTIQERDAEYGDAIELLIKETDKKVRSYLSSLQKNADAKLESVNLLVSRLENKLESTDSDFKGQIKEAKSSILDFNSQILKTYTEVESLVNKSLLSFKKLDNKTEDINKDIDSLKRNIAERFSNLGNSSRGGSMNRQIRIDGTNYLTRYTDINLKSGTNVTITASNDDTARRVNITITATGGISTWSTPAETPDGVITVFTVGSSAPTDVVSDGQVYFIGQGYTFAGGQVTFTIPPLNYVRYR